MPPYIPGIDVSRWEGRMDFSKAKSKNIVFEYAKTSQALWIDSTYYFNHENAKQNGLKRGAYHFLDFRYAGQQQGQFFWDAIKSDPGEMPPAIDFEWLPGYATPSTAFRKLYDCLEAFISASGISRNKIIIYSTPGFWSEAKNLTSTSADRALANADNYWKQYLLWYAHPDLTPPSQFKPWDNWFIWQYSWKGYGPDYGAEAKDIDMNYMEEKVYNDYFGITENTNTDNEDDSNQENDEDTNQDNNNGDSEPMIKMQVQTMVLNVRPGPSIMYNPPVRKIYKGDTVTVFDVAGKTSAWVKVSEDKEEWCCVQDANYLYLKKVQ